MQAPNLQCGHNMIDATDSRSLYDRALNLVLTRPRTVTYDDVASKSEGRGQFSARWLEAFAKGKIVEPGVFKIEEVCRILTGIDSAC